MSTQNPGSPDGTPDPSTPTGYEDAAKLLLDTFDWASMEEAIRSFTRSVDQMVRCSASFAEAWDRMMAQSTDTPGG